jgi:hypothetical protein
MYTGAVLLFNLLERKETIASATESYLQSARHYEAIAKADEATISKSTLTAYIA